MLLFPSVQAACLRFFKLRLKCFGQTDLTPPHCMLVCVCLCHATSAHENLRPMLAALQNAYVRDTRRTYASPCDVAHQLFHVPLPSVHAVTPVTVPLPSGHAVTSVVAGPQVFVPHVHTPAGAPVGVGIGEVPVALADMPAVAAPVFRPRKPHGNSED